MTATATAAAASVVTEADLAAQLESLQKQKRDLQDQAQQVEGAIKVCRHLLSLSESRRKQQQQQQEQEQQQQRRGGVTGHVS